MPLFFCLNTSNTKTRILIGFIFGLGVYSSLLCWLWPINAAGTVLFVLALCVQPVIFAIFFRPVKDSFLGSVYLPLLWVASEWLRTLLLNGFCFSFAYSQSFMPYLIQNASWGGVYAVVFVIVLVNNLFYLSVIYPEKRFLFLGLVLAVFCGNWMTGAWKLDHATNSGNRFMVSGIQANIPPDKKTSLKDFDENIETLIRMSRDALKNNNVSMVVWPETAFPADIFKDTLWFGRLQRLVKEKRTVLVFGAVPVKDGKNFNSAAVLDSRGAISGVYHKNFLVPFSEYLPFRQFMTWLPGWERAQGNEFAPGTTQEVFHVDEAFTKRKMNFGILICSESCYPSFARKLVDHGAGFIIVMLNDGWFRIPAAMMMHAQNTIMRAVENGREIISVANTGLTFRAGQHGDIGINDVLGLQRQQSGAYMVSQLSGRTIYNIIGDFFAEACTLFVIIILLFYNRMRFSRT